MYTDTLNCYKETPKILKKVVVSEGRTIRGELKSCHRPTNGECFFKKGCRPTTRVIKNYIVSEPVGMDSAWREEMKVASAGGII